MLSLFARPVPYGYCPACGGPGVRRTGGRDTCVRGHEYASALALLTPTVAPNPTEPIKPMAERELEALTVDVDQDHGQTYGAHVVARLLATILEIQCTTPMKPPVTLTLPAPSGKPLSRRERREQQRKERKSRR